MKRTLEALAYTQEQLDGQGRARCRDEAMDRLRRAWELELRNRPRDANRVIRFSLVVDDGEETISPPPAAHTEESP